MNETKLTPTSTCPVCACIVAETGAVHICAECSTPHHLDCWEYTGGCAIFGCRKSEDGSLSSGRHITVSQVNVDGSDSHSTNLPQNSNSVNYRLMGIWRSLFQFQWKTFLVTSYGLVGSMYMFSFCMMLPWLTSISNVSLVAFLNILGIRSLVEAIRLAAVSGALPFLFLFFPMLIVLMGAILYVLLIPPAAIMRLHFKRINLSLPSGSSSAAKIIADRIDMPEAFVFATILNRFLVKITNYSIVVTTLLTIFYIGSDTIGGRVFGNILITLFLLRLIILPLLKHAQGSRVTLLTTFQNRLVASAKKSGEKLLLPKE